MVQQFKRPRSLELPFWLATLGKASAAFPPSRIQMDHIAEHNRIRRTPTRQLQNFQPFSRLLWRPVISTCFLRQIGLFKGENETGGPFSSLNLYSIYGGSKKEKVKQQDHPHESKQDQETELLLEKVQALPVVCSRGAQATTSWEISNGREWPSPI